MPYAYLTRTQVERVLAATPEEQLDLVDNWATVRMSRPPRDLARVAVEFPAYADGRQVARQLLRLVRVVKEVK